MWFSMSLPSVGASDFHPPEGQFPVAIASDGGEVECLSAREKGPAIASPLAHHWKRRDYMLGISTPLTTWITPFDCMTSGWVT